MVSHSSFDPFWGPPTCKSNFCEEDYAMTRYIGEFINTLTNIVYIVYAMHGIRSLRQKKNASAFRAIPYLGLMAVGICSAAFHGSLKYHTQMMDDLSMQLTTTPVLHRVLTVNSSQRTSTAVAILLGVLLVSFATFHVITDELILHSASFVVSVTIIGIRTMQLIKLRTEPGSAARRQIWGIVKFGTVIFNVGYVVWLLDGWACEFLKSARAAIGLPWAFLLELHGWWHICTGIGAYIFIAVVDHLASGEDHRDIDRSFAWPAPWASRSIFAGKDIGIDEKRK